jgi:hypothetical protein
MAKDAILNIIFGANTKELDKALDGATKRLRDTAGKMNDLGKSLSIGLTAPIAAFGAIATKNAVDSAKAIAQVEAAVQSTGGAAGRSVAQLEEMAAGLQRISLYDDDQILKEVTANLLTFTNVTGTQFDKAQVAILNLSTRLGTDLTSASVQVGKALNDPIKGVTALGRAGVQFTAQQKELITTLAESGDVAGAQSIILQELETQFGGAAEAAANVDPYTQLANEVGNLSEDFGAIINDALKPFVGFVRQVVDSIKGWSDETKTTVLVIGGLLAVLGPTLIAVAGLINAYTTIKGALLAAKTAQLGLNLSILANPYVAAAAAVAVLVGAMVLYKSETDKARKAKEDFDRTIAGKQGREALQLIDQELATANTQWRENYRLVQANAKAVATWAAAGKEVPQDVQRSADSLNALDKQLRANIASLTRQRQTAIQQQLQGQKDAETLRRLTEKQDENTESIDTNVQSLLTATSESKTYEDTLQNRLKDIDAEYKITGDLNTRIEQTADAYRDAAIAAQRLGEVERAKELKALMQGQQVAPTVTPRVEAQQIAIPALNNKELIGTTQDLGDIAEGFRTAEEAAQSFGASVEQAIEQAAESMTINFSKMLGQTLATGKGMEGLGRMVLNTLADLAVQVGEIAIGVGISIKGIRKSLETLNPAVALIAGIALVALGTYAKTALQSAGGGSVPAFAQGGLTTGPMLAMVGDNQSGKEAIIPFERMGEFLQMAGAGQSNANVTVTGRLQGRDLVISNERTTFNRNRTKY